MKMMTGVIPKETMEISEILASDLYGQMISVNGAVHTVRDMGEVAFVVLRKREGLLQCVYEEGVTAIDLKELKEGAAIEVSGVLNKEERAPGGFEIRMKEVKILSEPAESLPLPIAKVEDEYFPGSQIKPPCSSVKKHQGAGNLPDSGRHCERLSRFSLQPGIYRDPYTKTWCKKC